MSYRCNLKGQEILDKITELYEQLDPLETLVEEVGKDRMGCISFIHEDNLKEEAQRIADDTSDIPAWVENHIDWEAAAEELFSDYSTVEFEGDTYYYEG